MSATIHPICLSQLSESQRRALVQMCFGPRVDRPKPMPREPRFRRRVAVGRARGTIEDWIAGDTA